MKRIFGILAIACVASSLAGCVSDTKLSNYICTHQVSLGIAANAALDNAPAIKDTTVRQATIDSANTTLALIAKCNPATPQAAPNLSTPATP